MRHAALLGLALAGLLLSAAIAIAGEVGPSAETLSLPVGSWLIDGAHIASAILVPVAGGFLLKLVHRLAIHAGQFAPLLQQMLTNALIDRMVKLAVDFALAAIAGAAKGRTVDVKVAPAVIALGAQRAVDTTLPWIVAKAGGPEGIAERIFRSLDLDATADAGNVLVPAIAAIAAPKAA